MGGQRRAIDSGVIRVRGAFPAVVLAETPGRGCVERGGPGVHRASHMGSLGEETWPMVWERPWVSEEPQEPGGEEGRTEKLPWGTWRLLRPWPPGHEGFIGAVGGECGQH